MKQFVNMADKRQSSLLAKTARVGEVRDNEADNEECRDVEEADYSTSDLVTVAKEFIDLYDERKK